MKQEKEHGQEKEKKYSQMREMYYYVVHGKKYWLVPLIVVFLLFGMLLFLSETLPIFSPFIYTLF